MYSDLKRFSTKLVSVAKNWCSTCWSQTFLENNPDNTTFIVLAQDNLSFQLLEPDYLSDHCRLSLIQ